MESCRDVSPKEAAELLAGADHILILCHAKPDGDTLGSGLALLRALRLLGKTARVHCADGFGQRYALLYMGMDLDCQPEFEPAFVVAVDVADTKLLGAAQEEWEDRIQLCIDHHPSNKRYAKHLLLAPGAAATTQVMSWVIDALGVPMEPAIATSLFTGLSTDTGGFRYSNVTADVHRLAARLLDCGARGFEVNKRMFETKSPARVRIEQMVLDTLEYRFGGKFAMLVISSEMAEQTGVMEEDMEGLSSIPRQIEGVELSATLKQKGAEKYRVSMRSGEQINCSALCAQFGGGGHARAAGCMMEGSLEEVKKRLTDAAAPLFLQPDSI